MDFLKTISDTIEKLEKINKEKDAHVVAIISDNKALVIDMNTEEQLFEKGIDSAGRRIHERRPYTPYTKQIKREKGQPTDRVTLKDTGNFYERFLLKKNASGIEIDSTDEKTFELVQKYGAEIFGLTEENKEELRVYYILPEMLKRLTP